MLGLIFNRLRRDLLGYLNVMKCAEQRERRKTSTRERDPLPPSGAQKHADRVNQQFELQISIAARSLGLYLSLRQQIRRRTTIWDPFSHTGAGHL
jgi:hypothetical protein